jgi:archaellum component FlaC
LRERINGNESVIDDNKKNISYLHQQMIIFQDLYTPQINMNSFRKEVNEQINEVGMKCISEFQNLQSQFKVLFNALREDLTKCRDETGKKFLEQIDKIERNFNSSKLDREGVLKEVRIWEKTIFIIEKKLENIYTLIERINKKGEL